MTDPDPHPIYTELAEELAIVPDADTDDRAQDDEDSARDSEGEPAGDSG